MKLSTRGRYGVKAMLDLALHNSEGQIALKSIANRQEISENYLEQLFALLRKANLVKSVRGSQGGYALLHKPEEITVGSILRVLEGSLAPVDCVSEDEKSGCDRLKACPTRIVWRKIMDKVADVVDSITLKDLMEEYYRLNQEDNWDYCI